MTVQSAKVTRDRNLTPEFIARLGPHLQQLKQNYFMIYFENSSKKRLSFFQERLIQHLWGMYRDECADQIHCYLDLVR